MWVSDKGGKEYEKPAPGIYAATIIDAVDLGLVPSTNPQYPDAKYRIRIVWVLDAKDSTGRQFRVMERPPAKISSGSGKYKSTRLYDICFGVFGVAPPIPFDTETLIGRSNRLFLAQEGEYVNIRGFMPLNPGEVAPVPPADFVRERPPIPAKASASTAQTVNLNTPAQQAAIDASRAQPAAPDSEIPF